MSGSNGESPLLKAALYYGGTLQWRVVPQVPLEKRPWLQDWPRTASADVATIREWWHHRPDSGVGIATGSASKIVVLDVDPRHGGDKALADLEKKYGPLPVTVECHTGGGGRHFYFQCPTVPKSGWRKDLGLPHQGLEMLADGSKSSVPPTIHPNGTPYRWKNGCAPWEISLAEAPAWLVALATQPPRQKPTPRTTRNESKSKATVAQAVEAYNRSHPIDWPKRTDQEPCPFCEHEGCFHALKDDPSRWICESSNHTVGGQKTASGRWSGDALDVDAWAAGRSSRVEHLIATGYLEQRRKPSPDIASVDDGPPDEYYAKGEPGVVISNSRCIPDLEILEIRRYVPEDSVVGVADVSICYRGRKYVVPEVDGASLHSWSKFCGLAAGAGVYLANGKNFATIWTEMLALARDRVKETSIEPEETIDGAIRNAIRGFLASAPRSDTIQSIEAGNIYIREATNSSSEEIYASPDRVIRFVMMAMPGEPLRRQQIGACARKLGCVSRRPADIVDSKTIRVRVWAFPPSSIERSTSDHPAPAL